MSPTFRRGDRVLFDRRSTVPVDPGIFAIDEGIGIATKWVEHIPYSDPPFYRVSYEDKHFDTYEVAANEVRIVGRAVWLARRL